MNVDLVENLAIKFSLTSDELIQQGIKPFFFNQLHIFEIERRKIFSSFCINSIEEFDQLLIKNPDKESDMLEIFQWADYLTHRIDEISHWIKELNSNGQSK